MKKKFWLRIVIIVAVFIICCIPIKFVYKDGGSVSYKAILYSYTKYHRLEADDTYYIADEFLFFPMNFLQ